MTVDSRTNPPADAPPVGGDDDSSLNRMAVGAGISLFGVGLARGLDFVKQVAMARLLGPQSFGLYAIGWNALRMVGILATMGLHTGVMHFGTEYRGKDNGAFRSVLTRSMLLSFGIGWAITLTLWLAAPWLTASVFKEPQFLGLFRVFTMMLPFLGALRVAAVATRISQRMQFSILAEEISQSTLNLLLFIVFYLLGWQLLGAIAATVLSYMAALALAIYFIYRLFGSVLASPARPAVSNRRLLAYSAPTALAEMSGAVITRVDRLFLGFYHSSADVGVYQAAAQLSIIMASILYAFNMILMPMISDQFHKNDMRQLEELFRINTKWGIYAIVPLVLVITFAAADVMTVLFGSEYAGGAGALLILTAGQFINIATGATATILIMTGNQTTWFRLSLVMMGISLALNFLLVPRWGMIGAAVATSLTVSCQYLISLLIIYRLLHLWPYDRRYLKGILAALGTAGMLLIIRLLGLPPLPNFLVTGTVATLGFFGLLVLFKLEAEDRAFIEQMIKRFRVARRAA